MANRKLMFRLDPNSTSGLTFDTHVGGTMSLMPGETKPFELSDYDKTPDEAIVAKYVGYKSLTVRVLNTLIAQKEETPVEETVIPPAENTEPETLTAVNDAVKVDNDTAIPEGDTVAAVEGTTDETLADETPVEGETPVEETSDTTPVDDWSFEKMKAFVAEKTITVTGRAKTDYATAIKAFMEAQKEA